MASTPFPLLSLPDEILDRIARFVFGVEPRKNVCSYQCVRTAYAPDPQPTAPILLVCRKLYHIAVHVFYSRTLFNDMTVSEIPRFAEKIGSENLSRVRHFCLYLDVDHDPNDLTRLPRTLQGLHLCIYPGVIPFHDPGTDHAVKIALRHFRNLEELHLQFKGCDVRWDMLVERTPPTEGGNGVSLRPLFPRLKALVISGFLLRKRGGLEFTGTFMADAFPNLEVLSLDNHASTEQSFLVKALLQTKKPLEVSKWRAGRITIMSHDGIMALTRNHSATLRRLKLKFEGYLWKPANG